MIETIGTPSAPAEIEALEMELLATFRRALGQPDFKMDEGFLKSGGDSLTVIETILEIEERFGVAVSVAEFMALDTAASLAKRIASSIAGNGSGPDTAHQAEATKGTMLSVVQEGDDARPLVCSHGLKGEAAYAITLAGMLPADQPVATLQVRSKESRGKAARSFRELETHSAKIILDHYDRQPCVLLGYSLGAHVALAIGHELARFGAPPALLVVLDDEADLGSRHFGALQETRESTNINDAMSATLMCSPAEPLATRLLYFRSAENDAYYRSDPTSGWGEIATGGVTYCDVSASHYEFAREKGLRLIAPRLSKEIAAPCPNAPKPSEAQKLRFDARRAARAGHLSAELACLNQAIEQDKEQPSWLYANLADAMFQSGDTTAATDALSMARLRENWQLSLDLRFITKINKLGLRSERDGIMRRLSSVISDHPSVHEQKAQIWFRLGFWRNCGNELRAGLDMQPLHLRLSRLHVKYLRQTAAWPELIPVANQLVEVFPKATAFRTALIVAYSKSGSPAQALRFRDDILAEPLPDFPGLIALGDAMMSCGRYAEALEIAERAKQAAPSLPRAHYLRGKCLESLGRQADAKAALRKAGELRARLATNGRGQSRPQ
jgi:tetratricopeptide (TPR) repeat protein/acyl carrier protein